MIIIIVKDREEIIQELMAILGRIADAAITQDGVFNVGLSGGSLGSFLAAGLPNLSSDFSKWRLFFCDERVVAEDDDDSTYGFYKTKLIGTTKLNENQFVRMKQGVNVEAAADDYEQQMRKYFPEVLTPKFDLLLLGMGPDGHTCSLFPGHPLLEEKDKWIAAIRDSPKPPPERITMTYNIINNSKNCLFAVCGAEKSTMVKRILQNKEDLPAGRVNPTCGDVYWILDEGAASDLQM